MSRQLRGQGNVYLRGKGKIWHCYYWANKKLQRFSSHSTSKTEALHQLALHVGEKTKSGGRMVLRDAERVTLADLLTRLRMHHDATDARPNTRRALERAAAHLTAHFGGDAKVLDLRGVAIDGYIAVRRKKMIPHGGRGRPRSETPTKASTINNELRFISEGFTHLIEDGTLAYAPKIRHLKREKPAERFFTPVEFDQLLAHLRKELHGICGFMYFTGTRIDATKQLEWRDCHLTRDNDDRITGGTVRVRAETTKTKTEQILPVVGPLVEILNDAWQVALDAPQCPNVFQRYGRAIKSFSTAFRNAIEKLDASCTARSPHALKHSFLTNGANALARTDVLMKLTGNTSREIVERVYTHAGAEERAAALLRIAEYHARQVKEHVVKTG